MADGMDTKRVERAARAFTMAMRKGAGIGARLHMEKVNTTAKQEAPVLTGNMRASGRADGPVQVGEDLETGVGFGSGVSASYVIPVHEKHKGFLRIAEAKHRSQAMPLITKEAIKEMRKVKP